MGTRYRTFFVTGSPGVATAMVDMEEMSCLHVTKAERTKRKKEKPLSEEAIA